MKMKKLMTFLLTPILALSLTVTTPVPAAAGEPDSAASQEQTVPAAESVRKTKTELEPGLVILSSMRAETVLPDPSDPLHTIKARVSGIQPTGAVTLSITSADFLAAGYQYGDVVTLSFLDQTLEIPVCGAYSNVVPGTTFLLANPNDLWLQASIHSGEFAAAYGLAVKDSSGLWTALPGAENAEFTVTLKSVGGYYRRFGVGDIVFSFERSDYPNLTDEQFANFRPIATTGMGKNVLYRTSSPIDPINGRNLYADAAMRAAGVTVVLNLADSPAAVTAFPDFYSTYYSATKYYPLHMSDDFNMPTLHEKLAEGFRFMAANPGIYAVHCTLGRDRAGLVSALLECFMGATYEEIVADYMLSYYNYYGITPRELRYQSIVSNNLIGTLRREFGVEDLSTADLSAEAERYFRKIGLTDVELTALRKNLAGTGTPVRTTWRLPPLGEVPDFSDVRPGDYCYDAVRWAAGHSVTSGTTPTTFSPENICTTSQIITFLWRACGSPESTIANPFGDVYEISYYYKAALWAYEAGLLSGPYFNGSEACTRAATVTYLWRMAGRPTESNGVYLPGTFSDVPYDADYAQAVAWAVETGITNGTTDSTFSPDRACTRGQIVTFLYRAANR